MKQQDNKWLWCYLVSIISIIYILWRCIFTISTKQGLLALLCGVALVIAEILGIIGGIEHYFVMIRKRKPKIPSIPLEWYPDIDVLIATHNEPDELLYKTINGCLNMDYPDQAKVNIYLCDDSNRKEMAELAKKMGVGYFGLSDNKHAKAGNLNHALSQSSSPLVVTLDADMIPLHGFLMKTVPYFFLPCMDEDHKGYKVGFVQLPQSFYNPDLFQYNLYAEQKIPNEQDFFFREINVGRNHTNTPIYAGSNTVISREALEAVGGICTGLITEDFATGILIQDKGYRCYAVDDIEAHGLAPHDLKSLIKQRERWARGCIQTFHKLNIFKRSGLSLSQKISYLACFLYWYTPLCRIVYILSPILFGLFDIKLLNVTLKELLFIWLPYQISYNYGIKRISGNIRNARLSNLYDVILCPYLIIPVLLESFGIKKKKFDVTRKDNKQENITLMYILPYLILVLLCGVALVRTAGLSLVGGSYHYLIIIYWLMANIYHLCMAMFFVQGRKQHHAFVRFEAEVDVVFNVRDKLVETKTVDISETGLALLLDEPEYIAKDEMVSITCKTSREEATVNARIVHVARDGQKWRYAFEIMAYKEGEKGSYYNIVYDRVHTLPHYIHTKSGIYNDLSSNMHQRLMKQYKLNKKMPHIPLNIKSITTTQQSITITEFSYEYVILKCKNWRALSSEKAITIRLNNYLDIRCSLVKHAGSREEALIGQRLYKVENLQDLLESQMFKKLLSNWIKEYEAEHEELKSKKVQEIETAEDEFNELQWI